MQDTWILLALLAVAGLELGRAQPVVRSISLVQRDDVQVLGQTENCKSVSIPAASTCGPGLECSPASGTCVPVRQHPIQYQYHYPTDKRSGYNKLSLKTQGRKSFNSLPPTADKPLKSAWTLSWNRGAIRQ